MNSILGRYFVAILACLTLVGCANTVKKDNVFPLGVWYEGGVAGARDNVLPGDPKLAAPIYGKNFADIEAHGVNVIVIPNTPPDHHKPMLDAAAAHHLLVIPELGLDGGAVGAAIRDPKALDPAAIQKAFVDVLGPMKDHPAFWRLQLLDEPGQGEPIKHYAQVAKQLAQYDPKIKPFCCLAGTAALREFAEVVHPDVMAFDFYPFGVNNPQNDIASLRAFEAAGAASVGESAKVGANSWAVIQCHSITGLIRYPNPAEIRCMTWLSLATGNKGVFWFLYQSEHFTKDSMMDGLVDRDFNARPAWDEVASLTKQIKPITATLMGLTPATDEKPTVIRKKSMYPMVDGKGRKYLMAVNIDTSKPQTLHLSAHTMASKVIRLPEGKMVPSERKGDLVTWHEELAAGSGVLYRVE